MSNSYGLPSTWPLITSLHEGSGFHQRRPLPDALATARRLAGAIQADRDAAIYGPIDRQLSVDAPWASREEILTGITAYHRDAMNRLPSESRYPEAKPWVDYALAVDREVRRLAGLNDEEAALVLSLAPYLRFRGFKQAGLRGAPAIERCRTAFLPATDRGPLQIKNVDNPLAGWAPEAPLPPAAPPADFWWDHVDWVIDGVGSGLHIDDEPAEIFPLPVLKMVGHHADDTPGIVQFLERYSSFWGGCNVLVYDRSFRLATIEKCSYNFFETFPVNAHGHAWISGMACREAASPQAVYQRARRKEYRALFGLGDDSVDSAFWAFSDVGERHLADGLRALGPCPRVADVEALFLQPAPDGLRKAGYRCHPQQPVTEYTLLIYATLFSERTFYRWQMNHDATRWPETPEVCRYR